MEKIAVIGGGISGLSIAQCLNQDYQVKVYERESRPGGLIKCEYIEGNLYHIVGGHVFNSKNKAVLDWFWKYFDREAEFKKADRNAVVTLTDNQLVKYPIENHVFMIGETTIRSFINDLLEINRQNPHIEYANFEEFLKQNFGETLYKLYFKPYNEKIWKRRLRDIPLSWLEGKLPMPSIEDMIFNNMNHHVQEKNMVHSSFYYPLHDGSQFIADRLAKDLDITYNINIQKAYKQDHKWVINENLYDKLIFCGNIKDLPKIMDRVRGVEPYIKDIEKLEYHGTTSVLCEIDPNPYSWIYMPSLDYSSHRIICTGNFSPHNNAENKMTATIEFTDYISKEEIEDNLSKIPFNPKYITHKYTEYTYPIQSSSTTEMISNLKSNIEKENVFLLGRFAEWEYYNMDAAVEAALRLSETMNM